MYCIDACIYILIPLSQPGFSGTVGQSWAINVLLQATSKRLNRWKVE
jgi:hypothetical protein